MKGMGSESRPEDASPGAVSVALGARRPRTRRRARRRLLPPARGARGLGVGVVSRTTVDAAIELAYETRAPVMLVASRRQVDSERVGVGYVEGWSTEAFARHVRARDRSGRVRLCRDHGGPWQHPAELDPPLDERAALASALASYEADLDAGFEVLHIDTSASCDGTPAPEDSLRRLLALYEPLHELARSRGRRVAFEIGCEDQGAAIASPAEVEGSTCMCLEELERRGLRRPRYAVVQTGTKVVETRNVGDLPADADGDATRRRLHRLVALCHDRGVAVKAHNCDYLHGRGWAALAAARVDAANVAPEYGVAETRTMLGVLRRAGLLRERDRFLELAYDCGKWRKWMAPGTAASDYDRAVIAGHYVFSTPQFAEIRACAARRLDGGEDQLDRELRDAVKRRMARHLARFGLL